MIRTVHLDKRGRELYKHFEVIIFWISWKLHEREFLAKIKAERVYKLIDKIILSFFTFIEQSNDSLVRQYLDFQAGEPRIIPNLRLGEFFTKWS